MPLRDDLLNPIAGENPSGANLKYERVYDQIKEARTEEDDTLPSGAWERSAKRADTRLVIKLAGEALAGKSKDLQLAAWLGEAHIKQEGATLLTPVLTLFLELQKAFWDTIYPEIDEGDVGLRAVPLQWAATRYAALTYGFPLTKSGVSFHVHKGARNIGYEADATNNEAKRTARAAAIKRGQLTAEEVDDAITNTSKSYYAELDEALSEAREVVEELAIYCEEQYADDGPSFRKLRDALEEVHNVVAAQLTEKRRLQPDVVAAPEPVAEPEPAPEPPPQPVAAAPAPVAVPAPVAAPVPVAPPVSASAPVIVISGQPQSWDDAVVTMHACASYMAAQRRGSAVPYLLHTSIRWGELRKSAPKPSSDILTAPTAGQRQSLRQAYAGGQWSDLLERGMQMVAQPCGRAWLDLHRYIWVGAREMGFQAFASMVVKSLQGLLADFPDMPQWTLSDDTPVADPETQKWLSEEIAASVPGGMAPPPPPMPVFAPASASAENGAYRGNEESSVSAEAAALAAGGQLRAAILLLARDAERQPTGRMRYQRRLEMAQFCVAGGTPSVAAPVLRELISEIDERRLETWESGEMVAQPLALMLQCLDGNADPVDREALFAKLCRIDPTVALELLP